MKNVLPKELSALKDRVDKTSEKIVPAKKEKAEAGRPSTVAISEAILSNMVSGGELVPLDGEGDAEVWVRREQVWRLHLKGLNKTVIAKFFEVSETTIYKDIRLYNEELQKRLTTMGPAGVIVESYSYYEQLRGETMRLLDLLDDVKVAGDAGLDSVTLIREKLPLMKLAKDIEDSKMRMLMGIGLVPKRRERNPVPALAADSVEVYDEEYDTEKAQAMLDELFSAISSMVRDG